MKIPSKVDLILWGLVALAAAGLIAVVMRWKHNSELLHVERATHSAEVKQLKKHQKAALDKVQGELDTERKNAQLARDSSNAYQQQLEDLRDARARTPARDVWVCDGPTDVPGARGGSATPGEGAVPEAPRSDPGARRNIGPDLYALADEADECAVQRDALIDWIRKTTRP